MWRKSFLKMLWQNQSAMENNDVSKMRKFLRSEITWFGMFLAFIVGATSTYFNIKYEIKEIKENHLKHISEQLETYYQNDIQRSKDNRDKIEKVCERLETNNIQLEKLNTILEERYK